MTEITESVTLIPTQEWSILQMLPIKYTAAAETEAVVITLPQISEISGGKTQLIVEVTDITEKVTFAAADGDDTINGEASIDVNVAGTFSLSIGFGTNWLLTQTFVAPIPAV